MIRGQRYYIEHHTAGIYSHLYGYYLGMTLNLRNNLSLLVFGQYPHGNLINEIYCTFVNPETINKIIKMKYSVHPV